MRAPQAKEILVIAKVVRLTWYAIASLGLSIRGYYGAGANGETRAYRHGQLWEEAGAVEERVVETLTDIEEAD